MNSFGPSHRHVAAGTALEGAQLTLMMLVLLLILLRLEHIQCTLMSALLLH